MDLILDANILFSVLIKSGITEDIVFNQDLNLYVPEFIFTEFEKYKKLIAEKTERNEEDTNHLLEIFMKKIKTFSKGSLKNKLPYFDWIV
jgi:predicted nucleic acid-binding protein